MLNIDRFVSESITSRSGSMFAVDIEANKEQLKQEIEEKMGAISLSFHTDLGGSKRLFPSLS